MPPSPKGSPRFKKFQCPKCGDIYDSPVLAVWVECWGSTQTGVKHPGVRMKPVVEEEAA